MDTPDYPLIQPMPDWVTPLPADQAINRIQHNNPAAEDGTVAIDVALIDLLRCGAVKGGVADNDELAYGLTEHGVTMLATLRVIAE